jgi:DNA-binding transcriptional regulator YbjK
VRDASRRTALADAAIVTLAREGSRGLTHRATDRTAGVPQGSTSYYFRTRNSLLRAVVARLAEVDAAELPSLPATSTQAFADAFAALLERLLTDGRDRLLARYELTLEASRRPELREALTAGSATIGALVAERFAALGVPRARERAEVFLALADGLLLSRVTGARAHELSSDAVRDLLRRVVEDLADDGPPCSPSPTSGCDDPAARGVMRPRHRQPT